LQKYDVVIVIEDQFEQRFVFEILNLALNKMCFRSAAIHKSSVCSSLGAGVTSCCVIDLGFSRTVISCVEEADTISSITFPFGGVDLSRLLVYILKEYVIENLPFKSRLLL
jgi:actin-related protein 8